MHRITNKLYSATLVIGAGAALGASEFGADFLIKKYDLGEVDGSVNAPSARQGETSGDVDALGVAVHGSMSLPRFTSIPRAGLRIAGSYLSGDEDHTETSRTGALGYVPVDGSSTSNGNGGVRTLTFASEVTELTIEALLTSGVWESGRQAVELGAGPFYRDLEQDREQSGKDFSGASVRSSLHLDDDLSTTTFGIVLTGRYHFAFTPAFGASVGARVELGQSKHEFSSDQRISGVRFSRSDDDAGFSVGYGADVGLDYRIGHFSAELFAAIESIETALVEHALLDSNVFPSRIDDQRATNTVFGLGLAYHL